MRFTKKRPYVAGGIATLAIVGGAIAYFTTTGSGTGTANVGTSSAVTLHGTVTGTLYPGGPGRTVNFTVDNPSPGVQRVGTIQLDSIDPDGGHSSCSTTITGGNPDFSMPNVTANQSFPNGNGQAVTATGSLSMNDTGANQNPCQNATLTLHLSSN